jgi:hypothetical protein
VRHTQSRDTGNSRLRSLTSHLAIRYHAATFRRRPEVPQPRRATFAAPPLASYATSGPSALSDPALSDRLSSGTEHSRLQAPVDLPPLQTNAQ